MNTENNTQKFVCENCGKEHDGSYGSGRFCSKSCRMSFIAKQVKHRHKPNNFGKNRAPYGTWKCKFCSLIFDTKHQLWDHLHDKYPNDIIEIHYANVYHNGFIEELISNYDLK